jgi:hypothetical protein
MQKNFQTGKELPNSDKSLTILFCLKMYVEQLSAPGGIIDAAAIK